MMELETYRHLKNYLDTLNDDQLDQKIQIAPSSPFSLIECHVGIAIGTMGEFQFDEARSINDNCFHEEEIVILSDGNPFSEDGAIAYEWLAGGEEKPIYGPDGPTPKEKQLNPNTLAVETSVEDLKVYNVSVLKKRMRELN